MKLQPCYCGYRGELQGEHVGGVYLTLTCPRCGRVAKAFTMAGLVEAWNKPESEDAK